MSDAITNAGAAMDHLKASRETLLSVLREAHGKGPKHKAFDDAKAWNAIFLTAGIHGEQNIIADFPRPKRDDVRRYEAVAKALRKARDLLAEENDAETGGTLMDVWWQDNVEAPTLGVIENPEAMLARMQERYGAATSVVDQLAQAADESAKLIGSRKGRGHPRGGSQLSDQIVIGLAAIFKDSTGMIPTLQNRWNYASVDAPVTVETAFEIFVSAYLEATGRTLKDRTIVEALERARAWSLSPENQHWRLSPFTAG